MISFIVPGPPVGKGRPRFAKRGNFVQTYTPEKTASYENLVKVLAMQAMKGTQPLPYPVRVVIDIAICPPASWSKKKRAQALSQLIQPTGKPDIDNVAKGILDAMNGVVYLDDKQVISLTIRKFYDESDQALVTVELD